MGKEQAMRMIDRDEVARRLTYEICIPVVREAMIAFSAGKTRQLLRSIIPLSEGRLFGVMPGAMAPDGVFGAKLISVFPDNFAKGVQSHQGLVILFDPVSGAPVCVAHAGEITAIRTAAASAVATDALARADAARLALFGYGEQALTHARAISKVRRLESIVVWARSQDRAQAFAAAVGAELGIPARAAHDGAEAAGGADIICTVTNAHEPILLGEWVRPGTHLNLVGSGYAGPVEVEQGAEFLNAKAAGLIDEAHIVAEIGEVLAGKIAGRRSDDEITVYKSLGHVVQDLASAWALYAGEE
jgi:ornithine cyclodeaminase/alanine dehydrogenase-like protein (mu-crystallin family)